MLFQVDQAQLADGLKMKSFQRDLLREKVEKYGWKTYGLGEKPPQKQEERELVSTQDIP